jgi:hypothetical protein
VVDGFLMSFFSSSRRARYFCAIARRRSFFMMDEVLAMSLELSVAAIIGRRG